MTLDPNAQTPGSSFVHEMNHADAQNSGTTPNINTASRADYVNGMMAEEAHGESLGEQAHNELAAAGTPEAGNRNRFTGPVYDAAQQQGADNYQAAHPGASQSEIDEAGRQAGEQAVLNSFQSGNVITGGGSTPVPIQVLRQRLGRRAPAAAAGTLERHGKRHRHDDIADAGGVRVAGRPVPTPHLSHYSKRLQ